MIKKKSIIFLAIILLMTSTITVSASSRFNNYNPPVADIYKEGIYHFSQGSGNKIILRLETLDKPMIIAIIENENRNLKYYIEFTKDSPQIEISLDKPLSAHTTTILGEGELSFSFK